MSEFKKTPQNKLKLLISRPEGKISRRELLKLASPLGKVALEEAKCTGCGLCALDCPTGALVTSSGKETDSYQLLFKHGLCIACGQCIKSCPEQCLCLERTLEPDKLNSPPVVLLKDEIVRCSECGSPIASRAMINSIKSTVTLTGQLSSDHFELCPACKVKGLRQR